MIKHISTRLILFIWTTICLASGGGRHWQVVANGQHDFQFEAEDDLQVVFAEPIDSRAASKTTQKLQGYAQEIAECPLSDDKIVLSLVLRALNWDNIVERKQERAIHKLSSFFAIPKKFISRANIDNDDVKEMQRHSLRHSSNHLVLRDGKTLGKIEFIIGCDDELFKSGSLIANQIKLQMADGSIDDIAGIEFGYWSVWVRPARNNGVPRSKRQTDGSGAFGEDEYEEYEDDDFENDEITEPPHTHRHRHGSDKQTIDRVSKISPTDSAKHKNKNSLDNNTFNNNNHIINVNHNTNTNNEKNHDHETIIDSTSKKIFEIDLDPDIKESVSKLESDITKTIENNNNKLKEVEKEIEAILTEKNNHKTILTETLNTVEKEIKLDNLDKLPQPSVPQLPTTISKHIENKKIDDDYVIEDVSSIKKTQDDLLHDVTTTDLVKEKSALPAPASVPSSSSSSSSSSSATFSSTQLTQNLPIENHSTTTTTMAPTTHSVAATSATTFSETTTIDTVTVGTTTPNTIVPHATTIIVEPIHTTNEATESIPFATSLITALPETVKSETDDTPAIITTTIPSQPSTTLSSDEDIVNSVTDINTSTLQPQTTSSSSSSFSTTTTESSTIVVVEPKETATERTSVTTGKPIASATQTPAVEDDFDGDYDDLAYDDDDEEETTQQTVEVSSQRSAIDMVPNIPIIAETTSTTTAPTTTTTVPTTTERLTTTEFIEPEPVNTPPYIKSRMQKQPVMAGKPFSLIVPEETFYDNEDGSNLRLAMYEKNDTPLKSNSWIQFNPETREIYGLPLDVVVSRYQYKLKATDSSNATVTETLDITVQQHKAHRTINHEISIGLKLQKKFNSNVDWQIRLIRGIVETLGDDTMSNVFVREIRTSVQDPTAATFVYSNETFPKDECPEEKLDQLIAQMDIKKLKESMYPEISIASVSGQPIANCQKVAVDKPKPPATTKNFSPVPRNQIDKISAVIGQLLIFKVPQDTFYDPEDNTDLKLSLQSLEGPPLDPKHWLQFDSKNNEFYGIPKYGDSGERNYVLVAEDSGGQTASDALVVSVSHAQHRDYNAQFEMTLGIQPENFNNSATQRRFAERLAAVFGDQTTSSIQIRAIRRIHNTGHTLVSFYNTTLHRSHHRCPHDEIDQLREVLVHKDGSIRHNVRSSLGEEFDLLRFNLVPMGVCVAGDTVHGSLYPVKTDEPATGMKDDYLLTFVLPAVIILAMLLVALVVACVLHRRRLTGKMELGDEEERRSFRSKGIPVIFQDELDEKPEIGNKSPIILKDEKPPLLPPSYTSTNPDADHEDVDEYVPPPAVVMGGRESRGKSPVTPSYRKPPPYVSP